MLVEVAALDAAEQRPEGDDVQLGAVDVPAADRPGQDLRHLLKEGDPRLMRAEPGGAVAI